MLAVLVALPPGTFRALDAMTRPHRLQAVLSDSGPSMIAHEDSGVPRPAPRRPHEPLRFRSWADVTFITNDAPEISALGFDAVATELAVSRCDVSQALHHQADVATSPCHAHCAPRRALIAACSLVI